MFVNISERAYMWKEDKERWRNQTGHVKNFL